ncbi:hypothetical protein ACSBR1_021940 [Camellia fascicularis]
MGGPRLVPQKWAVKASASGSPPGLYSAKIFELTPQNVDVVLEDIRPYLISDGGNVDVVSVEDGVISLKLQAGWDSTHAISDINMVLRLEKLCQVGRKEEFKTRFYFFHYFLTYNNLHGNHFLFLLI